MQLTAEKKHVEQSMVYIFRAYLEKQFRPEKVESIILQYEKTLDLLNQLYTFENRLEIKKFLWEHNELVEKLIETYTKIKHIFGENIVELCLKLEHDPEEDFEGLFVTINTHLPPEESLDLLERFDDEWFLDNVSGEIASIFTVTVRIL